MINLENEGRQLKMLEEKFMAFMGKFNAISTGSVKNKKKTVFLKCFINA